MSILLVFGCLLFRWSAADSSYAVDVEMMRNLTSRLPPLADGVTRLYHGGPLVRIWRSLESITLNELSARADFGTAFYFTTSLQFVVYWLLKYVTKRSLDSGVLLVDVPNELLVGGADAPPTFTPTRAEWPHLLQFGWAQLTALEFADALGETRAREFQDALLVRGPISLGDVVGGNLTATSHEQWAFLWPRGVEFLHERLLKNERVGLHLMQSALWRAPSSAAADDADANSERL